MLYHAGLAVRCWTFICSLKVSWTSLDCIHSVSRDAGVQNRCWSPFDGCGNLTLVATSIGGVRKDCVYQHSDTENTVLSQKSIWALLGHTQLFAGQTMNLLICRSLQNCPFIEKQNKKSLAFKVFSAIFYFSWEMCQVYKNAELRLLLTFIKGWNDAYTFV